MLALMYAHIPRHSPQFISQAKKKEEKLCVGVLHIVQMSDKVSTCACYNCESVSASDYKPLQCEGNAAPSLRC